MITPGAFVIYDVLDTASSGNGVQIVRIKRIPLQQLYASWYQHAPEGS